MQAMAGAVMLPHPFTAAVLGAAAILEIIHPDAEVPEGEGTYGRTSSVYLVGKSAAKTAGLPTTLHYKATGEEIETAKVIGDIGLILKDIGAPSVIGMMAFDEIFSAFQEGLSGFSGGPVNAPLGHIGAYAIIGMRALIQHQGDAIKAGKLIVDERSKTSLDPEVALISINTICRKSNELYRGPVTDMLIEATEPARAKAMYWRADYAFEKLTAGEPLENIVKYFDDERIATVEKYAGILFSDIAGESVTVKIRRLEGGARRTTKLAQKYWSFDPLVDITVTMGDKVADMNGFVHDIIPRVVKGECQDVVWAVPFAAGAMDELALNACSILNVIIPAAVAAAMNKFDAKEAADIVEKSAYLSRAIPGGKAAAEKVGRLAASIVEF